jgi:hypothetical protein
MSRLFFLLFLLAILGSTNVEAATNRQNKCPDGMEAFASKLLKRLNIATDL